MHFQLTRPDIALVSPQRRGEQCAYAHRSQSLEDKRSLFTPEIRVNRQPYFCLNIATIQAVDREIEKGVTMPFTNKPAYGALLSLLLSACATRPQEFDAVVNPAPADTSAYLRDYATCRLFVNSKFRSNSGQKAATLSTGFLTLGLGAPLIAAGIRSSRETHWKGEMASCLDKYGHKVCNWQSVKKSRAGANQPAVRSRSTKPDPCARAIGQPS